MSYAVQTRLSPNRSTRGGIAPKFFVMHVTEGSYAGAVSWLCNPAAQASADEVVNIKGDQVAVLNTASSKLKSWAVGNGNPQSMSWENEGYGGKTEWPDSHYATLADRLIRAQAAVKRAYGVTIPLKRTTSPGTAGICGHGDMARWFGGSDHYGCPGSTFSFAKLDAAIKAQLAPKPAFTASDLWKWARWYIGLAEFKGHARDPQLRPTNVPRKVPASGWAKVAWYLKNVVAKQQVAPPPKVEWMQILGADGKVLAEAEAGEGREAQLGAGFKWVTQTRAAGPLAVRMVKK